MSEDWKSCCEDCGCNPYRCKRELVTPHFYNRNLGIHFNEYREVGSYWYWMDWATQAWNDNNGL